MSGLSVMQYKHVRVQRHPRQMTWTKVSSQRVDNLSQRCLAHISLSVTEQKYRPYSQQVQQHSSYTCMCCIPHAISLNRSVHAHTIHCTQTVREPRMTTGRAWSLLLPISLVWIYSSCKRIESNAHIQSSKLNKRLQITIKQDVSKNFRFFCSIMNPCTLLIPVHCFPIEYNNLWAMENKHDNASINTALT